MEAPVEEVVPNTPEEVEDQLILPQDDAIKPGSDDVNKEIGDHSDQVKPNEDDQQLEPEELGTGDCKPHVPEDIIDADNQDEKKEVKDLTEAEKKDREAQVSETIQDILSIIINDTKNNTGDRFELEPLLRNGNEDNDADEKYPKLIDSAIASEPTKDRPRSRRDKNKPSRISDPNYPRNYNKKLGKNQKVAILLGFIGKNSHGMSNQPWIRRIPSVSRDLERVLIEAGVFPIGKKIELGFAARTARDVSAQRYVVSTWFSEDVSDFDDAVKTLNSLVPDHMCVFGIRRVTNSFHAKHSSAFNRNEKDIHLYSYYIPSFAFQPKNESEAEISEDYRITEERIKEINDFMNIFEGEHLFHNFSGGATPNAFYSSRRVVTQCQIVEKFERDGLEFLDIHVEGQNFMVLQISIMVGLTVAYMNGYADQEILARAWKAPLIQLPKAPGLGLVLKEIRYEGYNERAARDKTNKRPPPLEWEDETNFADYYLQKGILQTIVTTEKEDKTTLKFLQGLPGHDYQPKVPKPKVKKTIDRAYVKNNRSVSED